jgi:hypothetical protein
VLDFYCAVARLGVEVDGAHHDYVDQMHFDRRRDAWLSDRNIKVLRFAATDILDRHLVEGVLLTIAAEARARQCKAPPPPPSAVPLPRFAGEEKKAAAFNPPPFTGEGTPSSPAKRGRGTARSVVEGAPSRAASGENP